MLSLSLQLMLYGLIGVFGALAVLYFVIKIMVKILPSKENKKEKEQI